jgi:hypothetical protein
MAFRDAKETFFKDKKDIFSLKSFFKSFFTSFFKDEKEISFFFLESLMKYKLLF